MRFLRVIAGMTLAAAISWSAIANAQVRDTENESDPAEPRTVADTDEEIPSELPDEVFENRFMDEIEVVVGPQGQTPYELEMERQALMKEAVYADMRLRERNEAELAWRQADPDLQDKESRIKWGYSPQAEQRMRRGNEALYDLPIDETKPASLFRFEF